MGAKDSKPSFITYEDAVKRVSDSELRRIREAFKRCAGANGTALSLEAFVREVLCDGVPYEVAEWLYQACGGTKRGIAFKDLLCGIVVLTKGNIEEKIKFLWTLYVNNQNDNGTYMYRRDFTYALHFENASLPVTGAEKSAEILTSLFGSSEKVTFEQFRSWLLIHKDATVLSKWLLSERANMVQDLETPTFYQSLAGVTHLEERDIIELEKCFWSLRNSAPTGQLDSESLTPLLSPPLPRVAVAGAFLAFDENRDGHVDFKELCCGLSAACRGPRAERLKFCFKIFDLDRDGVLNKKELIDMVGILCTVANESLKNNSRASTPSDGNDSEGTEKGFDPEVVLVNLREKLITVPKDGRKPMFQLGPTGEGTEIVAREEETSVENEGLIAKDTVLTLEDFLIWSVESADALVTPFLELLFEVCHIVLGLRPQCRHQERDIVMGWLRREVSRGYSVGQFWYLVGAEWWANWTAYCSSSAACCRNAPRTLDDAIVCDESFTSNSTESMGSLLWRAETASVGSAGSSSGVSSAAAARSVRHPGPVDNKRLLAPNLLKVRTLTGEGGHLRRDITLAQHRDFELVPDALWRALALWYGGPDPLPRQVIRPPNSDVELELYPLHLKLLRHVASPQRLSAVAAAGGAGVSMYSSVPLAPAPPERQLAYTAAFSRLATVKQVSEFVCAALGLAREDVRLWSLGANAVLLDDERPTLHDLRFDERTRLLIELRNNDLTWPEEIGALSMTASGCRATERRETLIAPNLPGATGLHNLGNTCFMNAALQAVWNTGPLRRYFNSGMHLYEVNTTNPLGTKGVLALRYGELCKEVWSCSARSVAPLRVRWCVSRHARGLAGGGQHDAQELLAWLLDTLHEDLNRASAAPRPHRDSDGRPDQVVAAEAWEAYSARNASIITDLFYGQLKSKVRCTACGRDSVRFDTFNMLSLPLPMESYVRCEVRVMLLDGTVPVKYGVRVNSEGTYLDLKKRLSELCGLPAELMLLVELNGAVIGRTMDDNAKIAAHSAACLYAYETPLDDDSEPDDADLAPPHEWQTAEATAFAEVSVGRGWRGPSSLCMPALFCFKRSRSEIAMSQSPPSFCTQRSEPNGLRCNTLPKDLSDLKRRDTNGNASPTLSVKSLTLKPSSPRLGRAKFGSSPGNMNRMDHTLPPAPAGRIQYLVAVHRKQTRADAYFLPSQRCKPALFGVPLLVGLRDGMSGREVYAQVWTQVARLLSARPPQQDLSNHATDCDDSLGYSYPFTLRLVAGGGAWCAACAWPALCRGAALPSDTAPLVCARGQYCTLGYSYPFTLRLVAGGGAWCAACAWPALCRGAALPSDTAPLVCARGQYCTLGYSYPFTLRLVAGGGAWCAACAWPALCRGAALPSDTAPLVCARGQYCTLGYSYPFTLRLVAGGGAWCAACAWPALCRGAALPSDTAPLVCARGQYCTLGYSYPFTLRLVAGGGAWCAACAWPALCRGAALPSDTAPLVCARGQYCTLGYSYPFTLRLVAGGGAWCAACAWPALCRGAALPSDTAPLVCARGDTPRPRKKSTVSRTTIDSGAPDCHSPSLRTKLQHQNSRLSGNEEEPCLLRRLDLSLLRQVYRRARAPMLAIDWDPTALHLRYQSTREKAWVEHSSVAACTAEAARPVDLGSCLQAFTSEEELEQRYHCAACRSAQPATKKLQIWRAPPILIIHLKRFQYVNNKWIKSQKVVNFPFTDFDPTAYLAAVPQETILRYRELCARRRPSSMLADDALREPISESEEETEDDSEPQAKEPRPKPARRLAAASRRQRLQSSSLAATPVSDDDLRDHHTHRLLPQQEPLDLQYRLYAVVSHSGQMSGGHYVAYARNPVGAWLCYNDSMCRELEPAAAPPIDPAAAYLLFYERQGLDYEAYLPDIAGREPVLQDNAALDADESDLKKMCVIA